MGDIKPRFELYNAFTKAHKALCATILFFLIQTISSAQITNTIDFLVLNSADTLYGSVEHINQKGVNPTFYKKIRITDKAGKQKRFKRKNVFAFQVNGEIYESFWLSQSSGKIVFINPKYDIDPQNGEQYFLRLISKGRLSHYLLEWREQGDSSLLEMDLVKKEKDQFFIRATQGVFGLKKKVLMNYFTNCPELMEQIVENQFNRVWQIVDFYNSNCNY